MIKKNLDFLLGIHLMVSSPNIYPYCFIAISIAAPIIRDGIRINFYFINNCSGEREKLLKFEAEGKGKIFEITKGQLISKCLFGIFNSPKNEQKNSTLLIWYLKSNCFRFLGELKAPKRYFEINWPLSLIQRCKRQNTWNFFSPNCGCRKVWTQKG